MNRQQYRKVLREIDKQLSIWGKYMQKLSISRANAPTQKLRTDAATSLMVLSQQVYKLLLKRKNLVLMNEATKSKAHPSDEEEDTRSFPTGEQIF